MKLITSTDLKQWADKKDCQQSLPELISRLIYASIDNNNINRCTIPSGDATFLPGWDGIVDCNEKIDCVPSGISLWECGTDKDVESKINRDFTKRIQNPLGYDKTTSTFVFVTPRLWENADNWRQNHCKEWNNIVIYTAVELERWIANTPSVGIWLAEKIGKLSSSLNIKTPETFWNRWATGEQIVLPYEIILHGREDVSQQVVDACKERKALFIQALTQSEGIAFSIASIITCKDAEKLKSKVIVVTEKNVYEDLVEHYQNLIILTTITEAAHYSAKRGHSIIIATTPADRVKEAIPLPIIERNGFINSLVKIGIDEIQAQKIATDTARDINVFRRRDNIDRDNPQWTNSILDLLPAILIGKWNDDCDGDKEILETLSNMKYEQYESILHTYLTKEETPFIKIGSVWRIRYPYEAIEYTISSKMLTKSTLKTFRDICFKLIEDDDPDAIDKINEDVLHFRKFRQKYSNAIKDGVFQNLCLMSIEDEDESKQWVDETITMMLKDWNLLRFLSNRNYLTSLAEASPQSFIAFINTLSKNDELIRDIFKPRQTTYYISEWRIHYSELLFALEMLAWNEEYLSEITSLLLRYSEYENNSNYVNKPINTLYNIFRLILPQTYAPFDYRIKILNINAKKHKDVVFKLCLMVCKSLENNAFTSNHYYKWRLRDKLESKKNIDPISIKHLGDVVTIMLQCCNYSAEMMVELITLSSNSYMNGVRDMIIDRIRQHLDDYRGNTMVIDALRSDITRHKQCEGAKWALSESELKEYEDLLNDISPTDILHKNAWLFDASYIQLPYKINKNTDTIQEQDKIRIQALQEIITQKGESGLWEFLTLVKCPESMAKSIVYIYDDQLNEQIINKYKSNEISEIFLQSYLYALCNKDIAKYSEWTKKIISSDKSMIVALYAPGYKKELAEIADNSDDEIKRSYWESIHIGFWLKDDIDIIINGLLSVNRYSEVIEIIDSNKDNISLTDEEIALILYNSLSHSKWEKRFDMHLFCSILEDLDKSEDSKVIKIVTELELLLYRHLEHNMDVSNLRLKKEVSRNPELLIQIVQFAYKSDDGEIEQFGDNSIECQKLIAECAYYFLDNAHYIVSFTNEEGLFDGDIMKQYIDELLTLAKERKRTKVINYIIGNLLGDIPRDNNYPPQALCEILEELDNDVIDKCICTRIYNSRGVTVRMPTEGGCQERSLIEKLEQYKKNARLYPRMTKVFDTLIYDYQREANWEDNEAELTDLDY